MVEPDVYLSSLQAARILGVTTEMVRVWARTGRLRAAIHTPAGRLFLRDDVEVLARARATHRLRVAS